MAALKVLIPGDVCGKHDTLFKKVGALNGSAHGPFDVLLCVGRFFSPDSTEIQAYIDGQKTAPIKTYFILGAEDESASAYVDGATDGAELCTNISFLGLSGIKDVSYPPLRRS